VKMLPKALQPQRDDIKREYESRNWKNIEIGLPDYSGYSQPSIFVWATSPSGKRLCGIVIQSDSAFKTIREFLDANTT